MYNIDIFTSCTTYINFTQILFPAVQSLLYRPYGQKSSKLYQSVSVLSSYVLISLVQFQYTIILKRMPAMPLFPLKSPGLGFPQVEHLWETSDLPEKVPKIG